MMLRGRIDPGLPLLVLALGSEAHHLDDTFPVLLTGVGKVAAAVAVAGVLGGAHRPLEVINLGTAGALVDGLSGTHEVARVLQHDFDSEAIGSLTGGIEGGPLELSAEGLVLASGDVFVADQKTRAALAVRAHLCDMEGYAVAAAARAWEVPVRLVKHVSDSADDGSARTWAETLDECARALAGWVRDNLSR